MEDTLPAREGPTNAGPSPVALDPRMSVAEALDLLGRTPGEALPVLRPDNGQVLGVLSRGAAYATPDLPPRLGGMATPLGVYLTDGVSAGGAGFWGLVLSGVTLGFLGLAAQALVLLAGQVVGGVVPQGLSAAVPGAPGVWLAQTAASVGPILLTVALLLGLLRCLPMAGTHAAEHQVVHCIEGRLPLQPACVRAMPRVHPRCGTNLVIGFTLFQLVFLTVWSAVQAAGWAPMDAAALAPLIAAPVALLYWRRLGGWVQYWLATRPATERQIDDAIRAAQQVLRRRAALQFQPQARFRFARRVWGMGMGQVLLGYAALYALLLATARVWPRLGSALGI